MKRRRSGKHLLKQQQWGKWVSLFRPAAEQLRAARCGSGTKVIHTELLSTRCLTPSQVKGSHGETKPDKIPFLQELMQLRKHIIVYSSVPAASGARTGTAGHSQTWVCCSFRRFRKFWDYLDQKQKAASTSLFYRHLPEFSANINPKFDI